MTWKCSKLTYVFDSRWDTHDHRLADFNYSSDPTLEIYPGQDYSDARLKDFINGKSKKCSHGEKRYSTVWI